MRLGSPLPPAWDSPDEWVQTLRAGGFRAAYWPEDADESYAEAARAADIVIAEIGAWEVNPISGDDAERTQAIAYCQERLDLAERVGARCCVNVAGSRGDVWDAPHPDNLTADTFALIVDAVREIVDAVRPSRTVYALEPMPFMLPDSAESYLALLAAIDRPGFGVHLDPVNLINSPAKLYANGEFLRDLFARLGPHIRSVHAKDIVLEHALTVRLTEVRPGLGVLDYRAFLTEMERLDPDTPILVEHLGSADEYAAAVAHVRGVADSLGLAL